MKSGMMARGDSALAQAVAAARLQGVDADALTRVQAAVIASVASAPPSALPAGASMWSRARWVYLGGGALLLVGALQLLRLEGASVPPPATSAPLAAPPPFAPAALPPAAPARTLPIVPPAPLVPAPPEVDAPRRRSTHSVRPLAVIEPATPALPQTPDAAGELTLLRRALAALPSHPTLALELAEQHAREHAHGVFAQEREAIAIDAELALQRTAAAEARVRRFLAAYPRSPHAPRMRALLGQQEPRAVPTHEQAPTTRRKENR